MLYKDEIRYGYNDVMIQPARRSDVEHRSQCCPYISGDMLPIFTAPMSTVVNVKNYQTFYDNRIFAIIPRNIDWETRKKMALEGHWVAVSLKEFEEFFCDVETFSFLRINPYNLRILIDVANGNMSKIFTLSQKAREIHKDRIEIMAGNIANPETYIEYCKSGIDYVRVGIGGGAGCFVDGTKVLTEDGLKNIEDVETGDKVLTHTGEYRCVTSKLRYKDGNNKLKINDKVTCTPDHKFYVINKEDAVKANCENMLLARSI